MNGKYVVQANEIAPQIAEYWLEIDKETKNPTGKACWAYYPDDRPAVGFWIKVREIEGINNQSEDKDPAGARTQPNEIEDFYALWTWADSIEFNAGLHTEWHEQVGLSILNNRKMLENPDFLKFMSEHTSGTVEALKVISEMPSISEEQKFKIISHFATHENPDLRFTVFRLLGRLKTIECMQMLRCALLNEQNTVIAFEISKRIKEQNG